MATKNYKKVAPKGSTVCPYLMVDSVEAQMEFLVKVFYASITNDTNRVDGFIQHGEVLIGGTTIMMGRASKLYPARLSMNYVYVENADEVYSRALKNGATELMSPVDRDYGNREGGFTDLFGNQWWVAQIINQPN